MGQAIYGRRRNAQESAALQAKVAELRDNRMTQQQIADALDVPKELVNYYFVRIRLSKTACCGCGRMKKIKCRGLCNSCYYNPKIKALCAKEKGFVPRGDASRPTFPWSNDPELFPCDKCVRGAATHPRGLCVECLRIAPDWQPKCSAPRPLELCQAATAVAQE